MAGLRALVVAATMVGVVGVAGVAGVGGLAHGQPAPKAAAPEGEVTQARLMAIVKELPTARAALGDKASREGLEQTEKWLVEKLRGMGYAHQTHEFVWDSPVVEMILRAEGRAQKLPPDKKPDDKKPEDKKAEEPQPDAKPDAPAAPPAPPAPPGPEHKFRNYWVDVKGTEFPGEVLIVSCHYDAMPKAPGADDDGTGVACVMEMARVLKDQPCKRTVRLMFFTLEECGLVGSMRYVRDHKDGWGHGEGKERIVGAVSLDMLGYYRQEPGSQKVPSFTPAALKEQAGTADWLGMAGVLAYQPFSQRFAAEMRAASPGLKLLAADFFPIAPPDLRRSDHWSFIAAGWPALILSDTAEMRNPNYHTPRDTIETIDAERFTRAVLGVLGATKALANLPSDDPALCTGKARPPAKDKN